MAQNDKQWSSATPGLLIFLIDQSGSMTLPYQEGKTKSEFAAMAVNACIQNVLDKNQNGQSFKDRCNIAVLGYDSSVHVLCNGTLSQLSENYLRLETIAKKVSDGAGGLVDVTIERPVWVDPIKDDQVTNMKQAFEDAKKLVEKWNERPDSPAPVIINISDGAPYYDGKSISICMEETRLVAEEIMNMSNSDGHPLIFNARIERDGQKIEFPNDISQCEGAEAQFLYNISSVIPESYKGAAAKNELAMKEGSRGCIFEADGVQLIKLINFGSSGAQGDRME